MRKLLIQIRNSLLILVSKSSILVGGQAVIVKNCIIDHEYKRTWYIKK